MLIKIFFKPIQSDIRDIILPFSNQKEMNSFIYRTLGDNNPYHDAFSEYSISSIQGGKMHDKSSIIFKDQPYIFVSSLDAKFIETLLVNLEKREYSFFNLTYDRCEFKTFCIHKTYDKIVTISPIIVKHEGRKITYKDSFFLEALKQNCIKKLEHCGCVDSSFDIQIRNLDRCKVKSVMVGDIFNLSTMASFYVFGKPKTRELLYHLGLGGSTGSGFGAVQTYN